MDKIVEGGRNIERIWKQYDHDGECEIGHDKTGSCWFVVHACMAE